MSAKNRARARELAEKFLKQKRQNEKKRGDTTGKKRKNKDDDDDDDTDHDKETRMASYAASAWGKRKKSPSNTNDANGSVEGMLDPNAAPLDTRSRNAKKNAKKRAKKKAMMQGAT